MTTRNASTPTENRDTDRHDSVELPDGALLIYDEETHSGWIESTVSVSLEARR